MPRIATDMDVAPAYWRLLVRRVPGTAVDRLTRDIRSGLFGIDELRERARDLRTHLRPDIRERARLEVFPALEMATDGPDPAARLD